MKLFITKELEDSVHSILWLQRGVVVRLKSSMDQVQIVFSHFAHGDNWDESLDEVISWLQEPGWRSLLAGDLNVESRHSHQNAEERDRWHNLVAVLEHLQHCFPTYFFGLHASQ